MTKSPSKHNNSKNKKMRYTIIALAIAIVVAVLFLIRDSMYATLPIIKTPDGKKVSLYIPTGADYQYVKNELESMGVLTNMKAFDWLSKRLHYTENVHPGRYILVNGTSNKKLINKLRRGRQNPVKVIFNNIRTIEQLAGRVSKQIEADSASIVNEIRNDSTIDATYFIPNTYEFYWNSTAKDFVRKMVAEHQIFWNDTRLTKAKEINLTPHDVSVLASIVNKETTKESEMPTIAGVYLNRLKINWPLQADPTLVFALGDFGIRRVLDKHKNIESPYNTYKYVGLPPGPICIPSIAAIDAVLNAEKHNYYFFCAKDDLSGYHVFAKNISEHNKNAEKYRKALNKIKIYR